MDSLLSLLPPVKIHFGFSTLAVAGSTAGNRLAARLPVKRLRQSFAAMVLVTGAWVLWQILS
jgi:uncharacterized membrane protein YfcA